nr:MAG TPA: hypothetical protein [Caudoviricetes sp.]
MDIEINEVQEIIKNLESSGELSIKEEKYLKIAKLCGKLAAEKAQQERENWRTSFDNERFRADKLKAYIDDMEPIRAAAEKLVRCKGRYHSEQSYRALAALFGVKTPDLPPLEHENVHYADAAEMEIEALRQRIAELESRTVTVENLQESAYRAGLTAGWNLGLANNNDGFNKCLAAHAAGIKAEAE